MDIKFTKDKEWNYVYKEIPYVSVKIVKHLFNNETYYSVFVEKQLYTDLEYIWSIWYTKHNFKTLNDAKIKWQELYEKIQQDTI